MKKAWKVLLVALSLLILTSCEYVNKKEEGPVRVGLLLTSSPDEAYSEGYYGYAALKTLEKNYEIEIAYNENVVTPDGAGYLLNGYGRNGYDLVIGLGEMFNQPMIDASVSYPETKFVCINGQLSEGNVTNSKVK